MLAKAVKIIIIIFDILFVIIYELFKPKNMYVIFLEKCYIDIEEEYKLVTSLGYKIYIY